MSTSEALVVLPEVVERIKAIGTARAPSEACGIMLPDGTVIELPNRSREPADSYAVNVADINLALDDWLTNAPDLDSIDLLVWHTHPSGGIGPSKGDMEHRIPSVRYLVVTLPDGEACQY